MPVLTYTSSRTNFVSLPSYHKKRSDPKTTRPSPTNKPTIPADGLRDTQEHGDDSVWPGVAEAIADSARSSLDEQVNRLRSQGGLEAGKSTLEKLKWTPETVQAEKEFEKNVDLTLLKTLGVTNRTKEDIKWTGPIVYSVVLPEPVKYSSPAEKYGVYGIMALGTLPEIGDGGSVEIKSGTVAYVGGSDSVVYRSCAGGRAILFYISAKSVSQTDNDSI